ncbi:trinucleotide repeat-containing gene 18 isoform X6 [Paramuricea clavata]|nr:trinucleotide repeat-containing gene 18 isoform X6 [Paramuricea clavata]
MWERFNGSKVVRVKWFYHPEETKAGRRPSDGKNGLYLSSHVDENDVQTIAHKCEVVQLHDSKNHRNTKSSTDSDSDVTNNNIFWCLGTYDPLTETFPSDND